MKPPSTSSPHLTLQTVPKEPLPNTHLKASRFQGLEGFMGSVFGDILFDSKAMVLRDASLDIQAKTETEVKGVFF